MRAGCKKTWWRAAGALFFVGSMLQAQTIIHVEEHGGNAAEGRLERALHDRRLIKFDPPADQVREDKLYDVTWEAPPDGLAAPIVLRMTYRHQQRRAVETQEARYTRGIRGRHIARFRVPGSALDRAGPVVAWRVDVIQRNQIVDRRSSGALKDGEDQYGGRR